MQNSLQNHDTQGTLKYLHLKSASILKSTKIDFLSTVQSSKISSMQRQALVKHLSVVSKLLSLDGQVFEMSVVYLDRYLSSLKLHDTRTLLLLGLLCLNIAAEYSGYSNFKFDEIASMTQNCFSVDLMKTMKIYIMNALDWRFDMVTCSELIYYILLDSFNQVNTFEILDKCYRFIEVALSLYELRVEGLFCISISVIFVVLSLRDSNCHEEWLGEACERYGLDEKNTRVIIDSIKNKLV